MSNLSTRILLILIIVVAVRSLAFSQTTPERQRNYPAPVEGDYTIKDFKFRAGETLPELKLHYLTIGTPVKDNNGVTRNAVLIMHGTGGTGAQFLSAQFANILFGPGQLLDATKYYIILPDAIGHGGSSKPSNGLHMKFPHYTYDDMVLAQYRLITEKLGVNHLRLVMGTSMGGMHTWVWGETYPDFMDALMPLASMPVEIAGRNRIMRKMIMDAIRNDPAWNNGEYTAQPVQGLTAAENILLLMGSAPLQWHKQAPTRDAADKFYEERVKSGVIRTDANDMLYYFDSSREYNPSPMLEKIKAPLIAVNSADDLINPPELGIMEREIKRVKNGRYVLLPITDQTRGHGTHTIASIWQNYLKELLEHSNQTRPDAPIAETINWLKSHLPYTYMLQTTRNGEPRRWTIGGLQNKGCRLSYDVTIQTLGPGADYFERQLWELDLAGLNPQTIRIQPATKQDPVRIEFTSFDPHDPDLIRQAQANGGVAFVKGKAIWQNLRVDNHFVREGFETRAGFFTRNEERARELAAAFKQAIELCRETHRAN